MISYRWILIFCFGLLGTAPGALAARGGWVTQTAEVHESADPKSKVIEVWGANTAIVASTLPLNGFHKVRKLTDSKADAQPQLEGKSGWIAENQLRLFPPPLPSPVEEKKCQCPCACTDATLKDPATGLDLKPDQKFDLKSDPIPEPGS